MSASDDQIRRLERMLDEIAQSSESNRFTDVDYARLEQALDRRCSSCSGYAHEPGRCRHPGCGCEAGTPVANTAYTRSGEHE